MYAHFAQRMKERYNLDITPLEYIDLIQQRPILQENAGNGRMKVKLQFKGVVILAIKQKKQNKFLITALKNQ